MTRLVIEALKGFEDTVKYTKVITTTLKGAKRYKQIIRQLKGSVPIPSIIINGHLVFKTIPGKEELVKFLNCIIHDQISQEKDL